MQGVSGITLERYPLTLHFPALTSAFLVTRTEAMKDNPLEQHLFFSAPVCAFPFLADQLVATTRI